MRNIHPHQLSDPLVDSVDIRVPYSGALVRARIRTGSVEPRYRPKGWGRGVQTYCHLEQSRNARALAPVRIETTVGHEQIELVPIHYY